MSIRLISESELDRFVAAAPHPMGDEGYSAYRQSTVKPLPLGGEDYAHLLSKVLKGHKCDWRGY